MTDLKKIPIFGVRKHARLLLTEVTRLESALAEVGALSLAQIQAKKEAAQEDLAAARKQEEQVIATGKQERKALKEELAEIRTRIVLTREEEILQEVGIFEYRHALEDSTRYQDKLKELKDVVKSMCRKGGDAVTCAAGWEVNGSKKKGEKMTNELKKLMLRAFNGEADTLVKNLKPYKMKAAIDRLRKSAETIRKLGRTMSISISEEYLTLREYELELTAEFLDTRAAEKEAEREQRAQLREEERALRELKREQEKLQKEKNHYENALAALEEAGDEEGAGRIREQLAEIEGALGEVGRRAANSRAGYVYVISNIGAFGEGVIKIGMTRRLNPEDRVRELGDASVPFRFDTHALIFSEDAVQLEADMHQLLSNRRINRVNLRREFFRSTPEEARVHLETLAGDVLSFVSEPEAAEYRQSLNSTASANAK